MGNNTRKLIMRPFAVLLLTLAAACTPSIAAAEDVMVVYDG